MKKILWVLLLAVAVEGIGCAPRRPQLKTVHFRNCQITEQRENKLGCSCREIDWIRDVKAGWIAVCRSN